MFAPFRCLIQVLGAVSCQSAVGWELYPPYKHVFTLPWDNMRTGKNEQVIGQCPEPRRLVGREVDGRI